MATPSGTTPLMLTRRYGLRPSRIENTKNLHHSQGHQPQRAWEQFFALWSKLGQAEDADLFAMTKDHDLVLFWRKRPPTSETLEQLLQGCLESIIESGIPAQEAQPRGA